MPFPKDTDRCTFTYVDGRRCRMQKIETHPYLCFYHWQRGQEANDAVVFASQLLEENQQLDSPTAVVGVLSGVFRLLAQGRLQARQAATMAYVCQLVLQALPQAEKQQRAAAEARGTPSELYNTIQKGSFEEDLFLNLRDIFLGNETDKTRVMGDRLEQMQPGQPSSAPAADEDAAVEPGSIRVPGTCITLPPPLERETEPTPPSPPYGLTPEMERQLTEAGRGIPEEDLQRREERGREFGPPIPITGASERKESNADTKKRKTYN